MKFEFVLIVLLILCCCLEAIVLIKDKGIVASLITSARQEAKAKGWIAVGRPAVSMVVGKVKDIFNGQRKSIYRDEMVHIAFYPSGGLGDYIISAKILEELQAMCRCEITVYCECMKFGEAIYGSREGVDLKPYDEFECNRNQYDLALLVEHFIHVKNWDESRIGKLAPKLCKSIRYICDNWETLYVNIHEQCFRERIQFERCRVLGLNRYTELCMGEAFTVIDKRVKIPLYDEYKELFKKRMQNARYITINYGADAMRKGQKQLKMWPKEHYQKFIELIKKQNVDIEIVQLGGKDAEKIYGADVYILGESLELAKWILKNSECHIDCEGGLVHLATQLGTKCIVIFGPTPVHMYGYEQNVNLISQTCSNCMGLHGDWAYKCYRTLENGEISPVCMRDVTPQMVCDVCAKILKNGNWANSERFLE